MSDKIEYSRLLLKRTGQTGQVPTIPTGTTLNEMIPTDLFVGEMYCNVADDALWIRTDNGIYPISLSGITASTPDLGQVLYEGNYTNGYDIIVSPGNTIVFSGLSSGTSSNLLAIDASGNTILVTGSTSGGSGTSGTSGTDGSSGTSGAAGTSGTDGTSGSSGSSGTSGLAGTAGTNGSSGTSGTDGSSGTSGTSGTNGSSGSSGTSGNSGTSGTSGTDGSSGTSGNNGTSGTNGAAGSSGTDGSSGTSGANGTNGNNGTNGTDGSSGTSAVGTNGTSGTNGAAGSSGTSGTSGGSGGSSLTLVTGTTLFSTGWTFNSPYWEYTVSDTGITVSTKVVSFTPYNSSVFNVLTAQVYPYILVSGGSNRATIYADYQPIGDIIGDLIIQ